MHLFQCVHDKKGYRMIIKIFKISTKEMCKIPNKKCLYDFIRKETGKIPSDKQTIFQLLKYLPRENYYRVK